MGSHLPCMVQLREDIRTLDHHLHMVREQHEHARRRYLADEAAEVDEEDTDEDSDIPSDSSDTPSPLELRIQHYIDQHASVQREHQVIRVVIPAVGLLAPVELTYSDKDGAIARIAGVVQGRLLRAVQEIPRKNTQELDELKALVEETYHQFSGRVVTYQKYATVPHVERLCAMAVACLSFADEVLHGGPEVDSALGTLYLAWMKDDNYGLYNTYRAAMLQQYSPPKNQ